MKLRLELNSIYHNAEAGEYYAELQDIEYIYEYGPIDALLYKLNALERE